MKRITLSKLAQQDLRTIYNNIAADDPIIAKKFVDGIEEKISVLRMFPELGMVRSDLKTNIRSLAHASYTIYYHNQSLLTIERILGPGQDSTNQIL